MNKPKQQNIELPPVQDASECGAQHGDCPNTWKGSCDRESGHDGSHHCDRCNSVF